MRVARHRSIRRLVVLPAIVLAVCAVGMPAVAAGPGTSVSGTVLDEAGAPLAGILVTVSSQDVTVWATTAADGTYTAEPVPPGSYTVGFSQVDGPEPRRPQQHWPEAWSPDRAGRLELSEATEPEVAGIDAVLPEPASMSGTVRDPEGSGLGGICVAASFTDGEDEHWLTSASTAPDGTYSLSSLPPVAVVLRVDDCSSPATWLGWTSEPRALESGAVLAGVDVVLQPGASVSGSVRSDDGTPLEGICVVPVDQDGEADWDASAATGPDGTYTVSPLPAGVVDIAAEACDDQPYLPAVVDDVEVDTGAALSGVDLEMVRAATISGTVTDRRGDPVEDVCVQAASTGQVADSAQTAADGTYTIVSAGGPLSIQVVDCRSTPSLGTWTTAVVLGDREDRTGLDAVLADAAPASVRGTVTNVRGEPLAGICAALYLPFDSVHFVLTDATGGFEFPAVGPGTWSVAFLSCNADDDGPDVEPVVTDPETGAVWLPQWWGNVELVLPSDARSQGPDPLAAGADLLDLASGDDAEVELCFGCDAIDAAMELQGGAVTAEFELTGIDTGVGAFAAASDAVAYSLVCAPRAGGETLAVAGADTPLVLAGVDPDEVHDCAVAASVGGVVVARSAEVVVGSASAAQPPRGGAPAANGSEPGRPLAFVG